MRKCICALAALLALCLCLPALAGEAYTFDEMNHTSLYCAVPRGDGSTLLLMNMRAKENRTEGENPTVACLVCVGANGETLWEHRQDGPQEVKNIYGKASVLADGSTMLLYHRYSNDDDLWELRKFSPEGELMAQQALGEIHDQSYFFPGGMLEIRWAGERGDHDQLALALYGEDLQPVWQREYPKTFSQLELYTQQPVYDGVAIVALEASKRERKMAMLFSAEDGSILWQTELGGREQTFFTAVDPAGQLWVVMAQFDSGKDTYASAKAVRLSETGEVAQELTLDVSSLKGRDQWYQCRVTEEGFLLLGLGKTETRVRLWQYDTAGALQTTTDAYAHEEEAYSRVFFADIGGELYAATTADKDERESVVLVPLGRKVQP